MNKVAKCGVFQYEVSSQVKNNKTYKKYIYTFLVEFTYSNTLEYLEKAKIYLHNAKAVHLIEEENGTYYTYIRKNKRELMKGVNVI